MHETADTADRDAKQRLPGIAPTAKLHYRPGFKVYKLAKSRFPRTEFVPDPEKTDEENLEAIDAYIRGKEAAFLMTFDQEEILQGVLLKNGFMLGVQADVLAEFTDNTVFRAWDSQKEAAVCLDYDMKEQAIATLKGNARHFVCLEHA